MINISKLCPPLPIYIAGQKQKNKIETLNILILQRGHNMFSKVKVLRLFVCQMNVWDTRPTKQNQDRKK